MPQRRLCSSWATRPRTCKGGCRYYVSYSPYGACHRSGSVDHHSFIEYECEYAAVIDRIVHHGRLVQFRGEFRRVRHALMREG